MTSTLEHPFAQRLAELSADLGLPERGRQVAMARKFNISQNAVRKWFTGGYPAVEQAIKLAEWGRVNFEWLMTGRGPKRGNLIDTKALVLAELLNDMSDESRLMTLDFIEYQINKPNAPLFGGEKLTRFIAMLHTFKKDRK